MRSLSISERGQSIQASPIRKLMPYVDEAKSRGIKVYHLNIGQPDIETPPQFYEGLRKFKDTVLAYGPSQGNASYIQSLKKYYHRIGLTHIEEQDILITTGGSEALLFAMMSITSPGDEILVFEPFYTNYNGFANMAGINLVPVLTDPDNGYHLPDKQVIEEKISDKTKAILITSPNNPTGTLLKEEEIQCLETIALKHQLFIISDEVYREFCYDCTHVSFLSRPKIMQHVVMTDSISKRYSACGARVGCLISKNEGFIKTALKYGQARLCPAAIEQAAAKLLTELDSTYFTQIQKEYRKRRDVVFEFMSAMPGVRVYKPEGAFYMMVRFPVEDIEDFCRWLLTDFHVDNETTMISPGPGFYATPGKGNNEARIAYVLNCTDLKKALIVIKKGLEVYKNK